MSITATSQKFEYLLLNYILYLLLFVLLFHLSSVLQLFENSIIHVFLRHSVIQYIHCLWTLWQKSQSLLLLPQNFIKKNIYITIHLCRSSESSTPKIWTPYVKVYFASTSCCIIVFSIVSLKNDIWTLLLICLCVSLLILVNLILNLMWVWFL